VLHRELGAPDFTAHDVELLASLSGPFAEAFQHFGFERDLAAAAREPRDQTQGLLLLDDDDNIEMANAAAYAWLDELPDDGLPLRAQLGVFNRGELVAKLFIDHYQDDGHLSDPGRRDRHP
jgi:hypothetical protein